MNAQRSMAILQPLNPRQREAVTAPFGPQLVLAGPGSGKTRIITHRVAYLLAYHRVAPQHILAITFTNRAAEELRTRLAQLVAARSDEIWVHTFHAASLRLLREHGRRVGLPEDFLVADEEIQQQALQEALRALDLSPERYPIYRLQDYISRRKGAMMDPALLPAHGEVDAAWSDVARVYQEWMRQHRALDFDDLIYYAVQLLARHPDLRRGIQGHLRHVLVDEYQDINLAQYRLLTLLAPPGSDVTVVADGHQSIYGWRGAQPRLITRFLRDYRPRVVRLEESYRSTQTILYAAQRFIARGCSLDHHDPTHPPFLRSVHPRGAPIHHYLFASAAQERAWIAALIRRLCAERGYRYGDIAILYRTHRLADQLEGYLIQQGIPVRRVQKESFFQRPMAREVVRYLYLIRSLGAISNDEVIAAINFPRTLVDELTAMQLERLAHRHQISLTELARHSERFPELSPLTRANLRSFLRLFEEELQPVAEQPIATIVDRLFEALTRRRRLFSPEEWRLLRGWAMFIAQPEAVARLRAWLDLGRALTIHSPPTVDGLCAAAILRGALRAYLGHPVEARLDLPHEAHGFQIAAAGEAPLTIRVPPQRAVGHALAAAAWRLAQDVLATYEHLLDQRFVVYDLETTGTDPRRDEIVEIGAQAIERRRVEGPAFFALVRPERGSIPPAATAIHGLTWADVRDADPIEVVLPRFLAYVGEATVVGHNALAFDNRFIDRAAMRHLRRPFRNPTLDTLVLAQRLLPDEPSHSLEHLLRHLGLAERVDHRAARDVQQTCALLLALLEENRLQLALNALPEYLPLVGLGMLDAEVALQDENLALWHGALRARGYGISLEEALVAQLPQEARERLSHLMARIAEATPAPLEEDERWHELRRGFMEQVETFRRFSREDSLGAFLDYQALATDLDAEPPASDRDRVAMMTLHNAKGAEFPVVIIIGVEEENLPLWTALADEEALAEERRVFYVGMTRARERLYLCSVRDRGDGFVRTPSRFAFELPSEYVRRLRIDARGRVEDLAAPAGARADST